MKCFWECCHNDIPHALCCSVTCTAGTCNKFSSVLYTICRYLLNPLRLALLLEDNAYFWFYFFVCIIAFSCELHTIKQLVLFIDLSRTEKSNGRSDKTTLPFTSSMLKSSGKIWGWAFTSKFRLNQLVCSREEPATVPTASKIFWVTSYNITRQSGIRWKLSSLGQSSEVFFIWNMSGGSEVCTFIS